MIPGFVIFALVIGSCYYLVKIFTRVERQASRLKLAWDSVEAQLKRRHNLVPQLVEMMKAYHRDEQQLFIAITEHAAKAVAARDKAVSRHAERCLNDDLERIKMLAETDEELQSSHSFLHLGRLLNDIEFQLQQACATYNEAVKAHNEQIEKFPAAFLAQILGHKTESDFTLNPRLGRQVSQCEAAIY